MPTKQMRICPKHKTCSDKWCLFKKEHIKTGRCKNHFGVCPKCVPVKKKHPDEKIVPSKKPPYYSFEKPKHKGCPVCGKQLKWHDGWLECYVFESNHMISICAKSEAEAWKIWDERHE